jgi:hypothetical protein
MLTGGILPRRVVRRTAGLWHRRHAPFEPGWATATASTRSTTTPPARSRLRAPGGPARRPCRYVHDGHRHCLARRPLRRALNDDEH